MGVVEEAPHPAWFLADWISDYSRCRTAECGGRSNDGGEGRASQKGGSVSLGYHQETELTQGQ